MTGHSSEPSQPSRRSKDFLDLLRSHRALCIVRASHISDAAALTTVLVENGLPIVELALTTPDALSLIERASAVEDATVGAGTVLTASLARDAISAGATFLLTPGLVPEVAAVALESDVPVVLGALTPTEVSTAKLLGSTAVKLFPAHHFGPRYVKDLHGPFPELPLLPSGGVDTSNAAQFLDAGAVAVCCGSNVVPPDLLAEGRWSEIGRRAAEFSAVVRTS
jgi:2-dehydro-3-deoxyphosphogluconate aldolase / (4S)-4-hydroxy-2-oxoglutarate aldolase